MQPLFLSWFYCNGGAHDIIPTILDESGVSAKQADLFWLGNSTEYFFGVTSQLAELLR